MSITELVSEIRLKDSITFTLNSDSLNRNFSLVTQCLLRVSDLEKHFGKSKENTTHLEARIKELEGKVTLQAENIHASQQRIKELNANVGDQFMKKIYAIEEKTKNMYDFEETVRRLEGLDKFVLGEQYQLNKREVSEEFEKVWRLREDFDRYLPNSSFDQYKMEQSQLLAQKDFLISQTYEEIAVLREEIAKMSSSVAKVEENVNENNAMIKEINFTQLLDKIKKFKEETEAKVGELSAKMRKKVSQNELMNLEKSMIEKLDKFLAENERSKAEKQETKEALMFLERKINDIEDIVIQRATDEEKDALFSAKKWQCASCTKDLGKYEGKLGQYKPWSIFPCKELDPEKTGGFGYLNYIDKMSYKKGFDSEEPRDPNMERLNKTFFEAKDKDNVKRLGTTRGSNLITNYGSEEKGSSLKDVYFKDSERGGSSHRIFRVTRKQPAKPIENEGKESYSP